MNEYTRKKVKIALGLAALLVCLVLVVLGHSMGSFATLEQGLVGLGVQLVGLAGILMLLYLYNKPYTK